MDRPGLSALRRPLHPGITLLLSPDEPPAGPSIRPGPGHQGTCRRRQPAGPDSVPGLQLADLPGIGHRRQPAAAGWLLRKFSGACSCSTTCWSIPACPGCRPRPRRSVPSIGTASSEAPLQDDDRGLCQLGVDTHWHRGILSVDQEVACPNGTRTRTRGGCAPQRLFQ